MKERFTSMNIKEKVLELGEYSDEQERFEFKENWFEPVALGEYMGLSRTGGF